MPRVKSFLFLFLSRRIQFNSNFPFVVVANNTSDVTFNAMLGNFLPSEKFDVDIYNLAYFFEYALKNSSSSFRVARQLDGQLNRIIEVRLYWRNSRLSAITGMGNEILFIYTANSVFYDSHLAANFHRARTGLRSQRIA